MPRNYKRFPISLEIVLTFSSGKREARISDLSRGGCYVDIIVNVSEGETIDFRLQTATGEWMDLTGEVIYYLPNFGFGIRFTNLSEENQKLIEQIITDHGGDPWAIDD